MNNVKAVAKTNVINIIKEAKRRYVDDELGMVVFLEKRTQECVNRAHEYSDEIIKKINLLIARELVRVRKRILELMLGQ